MKAKRKMMMLPMPQLESRFYLGGPLDGTWKDVYSSTVAEEQGGMFYTHMRITVSDLGVGKSTMELMVHQSVGLLSSLARLFNNYDPRDVLVKAVERSQ